MTTWKIDYTYDCWKCPERHPSVYEATGKNMVRAIDQWLTDLDADHGDAWDYALQVTKITRLQKKGGV